MPRISTDNYDTVASWNGSQDLFVVEQPDGTKVATPAMVKQFMEAGNFEATGEVKDGHGNILKDMAKSADVNTALAGKQNTLTFDNTPTQNSNNPVKSGGIYTALTGKAEKNPSAFSDYTHSTLYTAGQSMAITNLKGGYKVKDGICYVNMQISFTGTFNSSGAWTFVGGFPAAAMDGVPIMAVPTNNDANTVALRGGRMNNQGILYIINEGVLTGGNSNAFTFIGSYPVA